MTRYINRHDGSYRPHVLSGAHGLRGTGMRKQTRREPRIEPFDCYCIWLIRSGFVTVIQADQTQVKVSAPAQILLTPGTETQLVIPAAVEYSWLQFGVLNLPLLKRTDNSGFKYYMDKDRPNEALQPDPMDTWGMAFPTLIPKDFHESTNKQIIDILSEWWRDDIGRARADALIGQWLISFVRFLQYHSAPPQPSEQHPQLSPWAKNAMDVLHFHMDQIITAQQWAERLGMNEQTFRRRCLQDTRLTPRQWMSQLQLERSKFLLNNTEYSIYHIAKNCGFTSRESFTRWFKQQTGQPPREWIKTQG